MRLPLGTLFAVGALLLAALAVVFSGHGLRALQEAGAIAATHFGVYDAPAFGVYATRETLGAQLMVLAFVIAAFFSGVDRQPRQCTCVQRARPDRLYVGKRHQLASSRATMRRRGVPLRLNISIVMQRTSLENRWATERWEPVEVAIEPVGDNFGHTVHLQHAAEAATRWRFTGFELELHRSEAEGYHLNLTAPAPMVFVMWRMVEPEAMEAGGPAARPELATVSYDEAARMMDGGEQVDGIPMPGAIREWMTPFVAEHYKPEPKRKIRRRDPLRDQARFDGTLAPSKNVDEPQRE